MSTSLGMTSPSPSVSTKLVAFPRFPTLPVRPERKLLVISSKTHNKQVVNVMYKIEVNELAETLGKAAAVLTDPVHILVHVIRHVIVDDMGHVGDVHPSGGHGSCHQDWLVAGAEVEQGFLPLSLKP